MRRHQNIVDMVSDYVSGKALDAKVNRDVERIKPDITRALNGNDPIVMVVTERFTHSTGYIEFNAPSVISGMSALDAAMKYVAIPRLSKRRPGFTRTFNVLVVDTVDDGKVSFRTMVGADALFSQALSSPHKELREASEALRERAREKALAAAAAAAKARREEARERNRESGSDARLGLDRDDRAGGNRDRSDPPDRPDRPDPPDMPDVGPILHLGVFLIDPLRYVAQVRSLVLPVAFLSGGQANDENFIEVLDENNDVRTRIVLPFSQAQLWKRAIEYALSTNFWGNIRAPVPVSDQLSVPVCRILISSKLDSWFQGFSNEQSGDLSAEQRRGEVEFVDQIVSEMPDAHITIGYCGESQELLSNSRIVVAIDDRKSSEYLWDVSGPDWIRLCRGLGSDARSGVRLTCNKASNAPTVQHAGSMFHRADEDAVLDDIVFAEVDSSPPLDFCAVLRSKDQEELPHGIDSGALKLPNGANIPKQSTGRLVCAASTQTGRLNASPIVFPETWVGDKETRVFVDMDGDGMSDFCRVISNIEAYTDEAIVMCTQLQFSGGVAGEFGKSFVSIIEL